MLNPDGLSVKGCQHIYAPKGQALEYAPLACNPYRGCGHACTYCYVPLVTKQQRAEFDAGAVPRKDFLRKLERDANLYRMAGVTEQVMLSFTTDPYHPGDTTLTRDTIAVLQHYGLGVCTLTKGGTRALRDKALFRPDRDAFACTLTSLDDRASAKWERAAAPPLDRLTALGYFADRGIFTWVSLEPTLDVAAALAIINQCRGYVRLFKVGKANYLPNLSKGIDWRDYTLRVIDACDRAGVMVYIKRDLQEFLPPGFDNPMRRPQHNGGVK